EAEFFVGLYMQHDDLRFVVVFVAQSEGEAPRGNLLFENRRKRLQSGEIVEAGFFVERAFESLARGIDFGVEAGRLWLLRAHAASIRLWKTAAPPVRPSTGSEARSGWGIMPMTLPRSLIRPAISRAEPFGLSR